VGKYLKKQVLPFLIFERARYKKWEIKCNFYLKKEGIFNPTKQTDMVYFKDMI
jgi:hypothetical protein